jgi:hypothetical protein
MERADPEIARRVADHLVQPVLHLAGGLVGKRHGEDVPRRDTQLFEQIGYAMREHARFARAGAGEDQTRTVSGLDGGALNIIELRRRDDHPLEFRRPRETRLARDA